MPTPRHVRLTDLELAEMRALEGHVAIAVESANKAREYAQHRLRTILHVGHSVELTATSSWQLDSETGLVVSTSELTKGEGA